jgi:hypothetical protein
MTELPNTYPYPLRPSELVNRSDLLTDIEPLSLTKKERERILEFEKPLFTRLKEIKEISVSRHVVYPEAFTTEKGKKLFAAVYLNPDLEAQIKTKARKLGIEYKGTKNKRRVADVFFDELIENLDTTGDFPRMGEAGEQDIERLLAEVDLSKIPRQIRRRMNRFSSDWAKNEFAKAFKNADGDVTKIENPLRVVQIVDPGKLEKKTKGYRELKADIKKLRRELMDEEGKVAEAERIVLNLYQRYINTLIAGQYREEPRAMEKIDHFLKGTGIRVGENGLFETIPEKLQEYAESRILEPAPEETEEFRKYNKYKVNARQAKTLCELALEKYGLTKGDKAWSVVILERKGTMAVVFKEKGEKVREVRIPRSFDRGLIETLSSLAEEVAHVLRYANKESALTESLKIIEELSTGRSAILSEAADMKLKEDTMQEMMGMRSLAKPYYYVALLEKKNSGSFKECLRVSLEARAKREYGLSLKDFIQHKDFDEVFEKAYSSALRIFRKHTPLDDTSGYLPTSGQLKYIQQELIVDVLEKRGLGKLLFVAGIDLYSLQDLRRLGMLDLTKVKEPRMVIAREIWPKIKKALDSGKNLDEAINQITLIR